MVREESLGPPFYYFKCPFAGSGPTATTEAEAARLWNERPREKQAERTYLQMKTILQTKLRVQRQRVKELEAEMAKGGK